MNAEAHRPELVYPPEGEIWPLPEMCPSRVLLGDISGKWAVLTLAALSRGAARFNQLRRALRGVTQKTLTQTLRRLERSGMISRTVLEALPVAVEYAITPLGCTLAGPFLRCIAGPTPTGAKCKRLSSVSTHEGKGYQQRHKVAFGHSDLIALQRVDKKGTKDAR